jgi:hypothetical protein
MPLYQQSGTFTSLVVRDRDLARHLAALGLKTVEEYVEWCSRNGFGTRPDKKWHQRCRERYFALQQTIQSRCARKRRELRDPRAVILAIANNELASSDQKTICQVRGKANRMPTAKEMEILRRWAVQEGLTVADHVRSR